VVVVSLKNTDGVAIAAEAIAAARGLIGSEFGPRYVPKEPRAYHSPAKNALTRVSSRPRTGQSCTCDALRARPKRVVV